MSLSPALPVLVSHRGVGVSDSVGVVSGRTVSGAATFNSHWEQFQVREAHCHTLLYCTLLYCTVLYSRCRPTWRMTWRGTWWR